MLFNMILSGAESPTPITICTWAGGTEAEIAAMIEAHYNNELDLTDYWSVGDERTVTLNGETHQLVLMNEGGETLTTPINGHTECAFVVGLKNCMATTRAMNSSATNTGSWENSGMRAFCNGTFKGYFSQTMQGIFKQHQNITIEVYNGSTNQISNDYFALPGEGEVLSTRGRSNQTEFGALTQFTWYQTEANRIKTVSGTANHWWNRSPRANAATYYCLTQSTGAAGSASASNNMGVSPFGVI